VNEPNRSENAAKEAAAGDDALRAADALLALGLNNDAVSRAYYAAFHYARALLLLEGLEPKSHRGAFALLEKHFEATGRLTRDALSRFARLQTFRSLADYDAGERLPADRAAEEVASARAFVDEARKFFG
jgi:uncharacterized protein (UPF0332 family)